MYGIIGVFQIRIESNFRCHLISCSYKELTALRPIQNTSVTSKGLILWVLGAGSLRKELIY